MLPPLAEQRRIVAKVDELMALVDALETQFAARQLHHAFQEIENKPFIIHPSSFILSLMLGSTLFNDPLSDKRFDFQVVNPPYIRDNSGNGYIWSTTGSGKTLISFKASTLIKDKSDIKECLFVVDRKDLDSQTREEFTQLQKGCVEENANTASLVRPLLSDSKADKVIVTTIQNHRAVSRRKSAGIENTTRLFCGETEVSLVA